MPSVRNIPEDSTLTDPTEANPVEDRTDPQTDNNHLKPPRPKLRHRVSSKIFRTKTELSRTNTNSSSTSSLARTKSAEVAKEKKHKGKRPALEQRQSRTGMSLTQISQLPWNVMWRTAIVRLPRAVPSSVIRYTCPEGPQPVIINLPSRSTGRTIPCYAFISPAVVENPSQPPPVVIDFHGGGFFLGSCLEQAPFCAHMARELGAVVLSVDYRMGPIDKHPAAVHDGEDVLSAVLDPQAPGYTELRAAISAHVRKLRKTAGASPYAGQAEKDQIQLDTTRVCISGFSSGGNLALNMGVDISPPTLPEPWPSRFSKEYKHPIPLLLYYPSLDLRQLPSERTRPPKLPLSKGMLADLGDQLAPTYCPRDQTSHPRASPGLAPIANGGIHEQAKMLLVLPELDNLSEQSEIWVEMVANEGRKNDIRVERYPGIKHGWTQMPESWLNEAEKSSRIDAIDKGVEFTRNVWAGKGIHGEESI